MTGRLPLTRQLAGIVAALVVAALAVGGCGVPLEGAARPVEGVATATEPPPPPPEGQTVDYWFVSDDHLVAEREKSALPLSVEAILARLAAGPADNGDTSLRSLVADPVGGADLVEAADPAEQVSAGATVTVRLAPTFGALPPAEQPLLLGQVVMTLTGAGAAAVRMTDPEGSVVSVPLPDGRVHDGPATRADYQPLVGPRPTAASSPG